MQTASPEVIALLIEDSAVDRRYFQCVADRMPGLELNVAENWSQGMRMVMIADLLIVDLNLPDVPTESEAVENVCRLAKTWPVIVYSASESPGVVNKCLDAGVVAFLRKDQTFPQQLRDALCEAASRTRRRVQCESHTVLSETAEQLKAL